MVNHKIPNIRDPREGVGEDKNGILLMQPVDEKENGPNETQPPKGGGNDDLLLLLGRIPLHNEPAGEDGVSTPTNRFPETPIDTKKLPVG
jgi:hypothetical protein